ncbi:MAG: hypothetical protein AB1585_20030, partial [Thermodesulfobacteriota bacterium]
GLVEFLIAIAIFSVLIVGVLYGSYNSQTKTYELETRKIDLRRNLQQAMEDISKELRMAKAIASSSANAITFTSVQDGNLRSFTFSSSEETLTYTNGASTRTFSGISQFTVTTYPSTANRITIGIEGKTIHRGKAYYQAMTSDVTLRNV